MAGVGIVALAGLSVWALPERTSGEPVQARASAQPAAATPGAVGTSGVHDGAAENEAGVIITEIETITGATDAMALVGRRVDLHVEVQERAADRAFWVGSPDNRILVVLEHDTGRHAPPTHRVLPIHRGQRAGIAGFIRPLPKPEQRADWKLTQADQRELGDRTIYIRARTVHSEGHGGL